MDIKKKKVAVIGAGISGLSAAAYAAQQGHEVHVFEKSETPGGRARSFTTENGYTFDMGPSWYWMPDIMEGFFSDFGSSTADFFSLVRLDPQFEMVFENGSLELPDRMEAMAELFEACEAGAGRQFRKFMEDAKYKYDAGMRDFVNKPCHSWSEFFSMKVIGSAFRLDLLSDYRSYVARYFKDPRLRSLMEFPVIFLGAAPKDIPALYSLMNYGGYALGTQYPIGGFYRLVSAMHEVALREGVIFHFGSGVEAIHAAAGRVSHISAGGLDFHCDAVIASSDYHHTETLLKPEFRNYTEKYWETRTFAPSCLIFYLGFRGRIEGLRHHTLFFENDFDRHIDAIYGSARWPDKPLFYACCPSKTDPGVAPEGHENVFLLMPVATGLDPEPGLTEGYLNDMLARLERHTGCSGLRERLDFVRSYSVSDFGSDYNAYGGNAYGLANTLSQTAVLKPSLKNRKLGNLFYTGQLTVPGPGVPPSIISGRIAAAELLKL
ncbi:oleate hydratase [uncultured Flavobacterium sp.]|uniref:phytoene desaturase family protein n=1 Tax=uncultured Flavobacterium sp. TaxID=165435 RepID=UPI0025EB11CF|nr:oleate hydratase [uncultured Flavobacterium sp.]